MAGKSRQERDTCHTAGFMQQPYGSRACSRDYTPACRQRLQLAATPIPAFTILT